MPERKSIEGRKKTEKNQITGGNKKRRRTRGIQRSMRRVRREHNKK